MTVWVVSNPDAFPLRIFSTKKKADEWVAVYCKASQDIGMFNLFASAFALDRDDFIITEMEVE